MLYSFKKDSGLAMNMPAVVAGGNKSSVTDLPSAVPPAAGKTCHITIKHNTNSWFYRYLVAKIRLIACLFWYVKKETHRKMVFRQSLPLLVVMACTIQQVRTKTSMAMLLLRQKQASKP